MKLDGFALLGAFGLTLAIGSSTLTKLWIYFLGLRTAITITGVIIALVLVLAFAIDEWLADRIDNHNSGQTIAKIRAVLVFLSIAFLLGIARGVMG